MAAASVRGFFRRAGQGIVDYVKQVKNDYVLVAKGTATTCRERPIRSGFIGLGLGGLTYAYRTNPSEEDMLNELRECRQQLALVPSSIHNPLSDKELERRNLLLAQNRLHYYNLWFFSFLVAGTHDDHLKAHYALDSNLKPWFWEEYWNNLLDVGFLGSWHKLSSSLVDFDVNPVEMEALPADSKS